MRCLFATLVVLAPTALACSFDATGNGLVPTGDVGDTTAGTTTTAPVSSSSTSTGDPEVPTSTGGVSDAMTSSPTDTATLTTEPVDPVTGESSGDSSSSSGDSGDVSSSGSSGPGPMCGDGNVDAGEQCDDGNADDSDACLATCTNAACGDGHLFAGTEQCDDGNQDETDECTSKCLAPTCTDAEKNGKETDVDCGGGGGSGCKVCDVTKACGGDNDCSSGLCDANVCRLPKNCMELKSKGKPTGMYSIDPDVGGPVPPFDVWCEQEQMGGGWTLVLKADGNEITFKYDDPKWTDPMAWQPHPNVERTETKLLSFSTVPVSEVLLAMEAPKSADMAMPLNLKYLMLNIADVPSLFSIFMAETTVTTDSMFGGWSGLVAGSALQPFCRREGFNVQANTNQAMYARARIGMIGNQDNANDCDSHNSFIGIGATTNTCGNNSYMTTTGNGAVCTTPSNKDIKGFALIFVR